jgi:uncharacterized protein (DUF1800 family)
MSLAQTPLATALRRFAYGGAPRDVAAMARDPKGALLAELARPLPGEPPALANTQSALLAVENLRRRVAQRGAEAAAAAAPPPETPLTSFPPGEGPYPEEVLRQAMEWRAAQARRTDAPFQERLVQFWGHFFTVSRTTRIAATAASVFEFEAIRPHLHGRFADMLQAAVFHVAMLDYLNNATSFGINSPRGQRLGGRRGVNENLAREVMELHSLGADGGYGQADVTAFANALSGWGIAPAGPPPRRAFPGTVFNRAFHEPGPKTVLGRVFAEDGPNQARAIVAMLAEHPSTARNVARRMALHFVGERAPESLVQRLAAVFRDTGGDLPSLHRALVEAPECWSAPPAKLRPPLEFLLAVTRLLDQPLPPGWFGRPLMTLGQAAQRAPSPKGWDEADDAWATSDGIKSRLDLCAALAPRWARALDPRRVAEEALGPALSAETRRLVAQAATPEQGLTLLLMSPEVQRR